MNTIKNIQFTNLIKAGGQLHEFNFRRSLGLNGPQFIVDVADQRGERHYIRFGFEANRWNLQTANVPDWISEVIPKIHQALAEVVG